MGRAKTASGAPACFLSGIFRAGSLDPLARGCRTIWRGEGWFRPARCCSTGAGRLDLDLLISGPRVNLSYQPYARGGADGQAVVCPLLRGSSATRGVAPKQHRGPALTYFISLTRAGALMARPWSARCYGVARQREGSRQNSIGGPRVNLVYQPYARGGPRCCFGATPLVAELP